MFCIYENNNTNITHTHKIITQKIRNKLRDIKKKNQQLMKRKIYLKNDTTTSNSNSNK